MAKVKVQITMEDKLLYELNDYCDKNYINRSLAISQAVVAMVNQQRMVDAISDVSIALKIAAEKGTLDDNTKKEIQNFEALSKMFLMGR